MTSFRHPERLGMFGFVCSALVLVAGLVALLSPWGTVIASVLLTVSAMAFAVGFGAARARRGGFDIGLLLPIAAALPLFGVFYALGVFIFERFGQAVGGWLLIGLGAVMALAAGVWGLRSPKTARQ